MIKVVYIAGHDRSGSTLLDRLVGQMEGFTSAGELRHIWARGLAENQACGCGAPFHDCPFWTEVVRGAFGPLDRARIHYLMHLARGVASARTVPRLAFPVLRSPSYSTRFREFTNIVRPLYQSIQGVTGGSVIVDSSKSPSYGLLLSQVPGLDVHVVHLVRDSRAVAYSQQRPKLKPEIHWEERRMQVKPPIRTAVTWVLTNALLHLLERRGRYSRVRYEDFVRDPRATLARISADAGQSRGDFPFVEGERAWLGQAHTVSGNPIRFQQGWTRMAPDSEWEHRLGRWDRRIISAVTAPLLVKYGYL